MKRLSNQKGKFIIFCKTSEERVLLLDFFRNYEFKQVGKVFPFIIDPHIIFDGNDKSFQTCCKESFLFLRKDSEVFKFRDFSLT